MITWEQKLDWVGMFATRVSKKYDQCGIYNWRVDRVSGGGLVTFGDTIEAAARSQPIDWHSVACKITEHEWARVAHQ